MVKNTHLILSGMLIVASLFADKSPAYTMTHAMSVGHTENRQLRHHGDHDELRAAAEESAEELREHQQNCGRFHPRQ